MAINLTNQVTVLSNCKAFRALAKNQIVARNRILQKMSRAKLKAYYLAGKDPVFNEIYDLYKAMDNYFSDLLEVD